MIIREVSPLWRTSSWPSRQDSRTTAYLFPRHLQEDSHILGHRFPF